VTLVTSLAVDTESQDRKIRYPQISRLTPEKRRLAYWRCAVGFFSTSARCNPHWTHVLYTNDSDPVRIGLMDIRLFLGELGVTIRHLPFENYRPPHGLSTTFRNAFYKHEVLEAAASDHEGGIILLDCDCISSRHEPEIASLLCGNSLLLLDVAPHRDPFHRTQGISRADMGQFFRAFDSSYPVRYPRWFGGEFVAGPAPLLRRISKEFKATFRMVTDHPEAANLRISSGQTMLDNDEFIASYVYNRSDISHRDAGAFVKRMWTGEDASRCEDDRRYAIWHLPNEKNTGFPLLFAQCIDPASEFWRVPLNDLPAFLGGFFGVPHRTQFPSQSTCQRAANSAKRLAKQLIPHSIWNGARKWLYR